MSKTSHHLSHDLFTQFHFNAIRYVSVFYYTEIETHRLLGEGEFGVVLGVDAIHVKGSCPCPKCSIQKKVVIESMPERAPPPSTLPAVQELPMEIDCPCSTCGQMPISSVANKNKQEANNNGQEGKGPPTQIDCICSTCGQITKPDGGEPTTTTIDELRVASIVPQHQSVPSSLDDLANENYMDSNFTSASSAKYITVTNNRSLVASVSRGISFAEEMKAQEDDSTLSTDSFQDDLTDSLAGDAEEDGLVDGEEHYQRDYMCKHCHRNGRPRYAVKRLREELHGENLLEASFDLAVEAKFLSSIQHPNIVKIRATVERPGSPNFMIIMDALNMTLRDKLEQWKEVHKKHPKSIFGFLTQRSQTAMDDVFADKLLAVYDIARAMRYLHNHSIIFRDLKPENLAFDLRGDMRLFDFGLAKELKKKDLVEPPDGFEATGLTGSRRYMAPEVRAIADGFFVTYRHAVLTIRNMLSLYLYLDQFRL
jgi:serine/threonine protein kinase